MNWKWIKARWRDEASSNLKLSLEPLTDTERSNLTDSMLIERIKLGDEKSFDVIRNKYQKKVFDNVNANLNCLDDVYEVTQIVFCKFWSALDRYDIREPLWPWLSKVALNECRGFWKKQKREKRRSVNESSVQVNDNKDGETDYLDSLPEDSFPIHEQYEKLEGIDSNLLKDLDDCMEKLLRHSQDQYDVIHLLYMAELSEGESEKNAFELRHQVKIAAKLNKSKQEVSRLKKGGVSFLSKCMTKKGVRND